MDIQGILSSSTIIFLQSNINWISGISGILFSCITVVIALLAFQRAKETILQPVRTEVIKKQIDLLSGLLNTLGSPVGIDLTKKLDYQGIVDVNVSHQLYQHGLIQCDTYKEKFWRTKHAVILRGGSEEAILEPLTVFNDQKEGYEDGESERIKNKIDQAKAGKVTVGIINLTDTYSDFHDSLQNFLEDPFLPKAIQVPLKIFINNIQTNLNTHLKEVLEIFILDLFIRQKGKEKFNTTFSTYGIFNEFNDKRIDNNADYIKLLNKIRRYLRVDTMP